MKKYFCFWLVLLTTFITLNAQEKIIRNPYVESYSSDRISLDKIVCTDTATCLYMDGYSTPGDWIRIASGSFLTGAGGRIYRFLSSENIRLDEKTYMPESGNVSFILRFEPLVKHERTISFSEGDIDGAFKIDAIHLEKQTPPKTAVCCKIEGVVVNRPQSSRLKLVRANASTNTTGVYIPIRDNRFSYVLNCEEEEAYELIFMDEKYNGAWRPVPFFAETGTVRFTLYPMERNGDNKIEGGKLNEEYRQYVQKREELFAGRFDSVREKRKVLMAKNIYYSETATALMKEMKNNQDAATHDSLVHVYNQMQKTGTLFTSEGRVLQEELDTIQKESRAWTFRYAEEHPTIVGYKIMLETFFGDNQNKKYSDMPFDLTIYERLFTEIYAPLYPKHVYTEMMKNMLVGQTVAVGGYYIDFTAPDLQGNPVTLSSRIKGKVALIDLWASWCGPCRKMSVSLIPVYEKYKDKGFAVVGVAREEKNTKAMEQAIALHKFPWLNLVELNDQARIWEKYGVGNAGGATFLVDGSGKILAISPSAEEVDKILADLYK